jgi:hypothetical protein
MENCDYKNIPEKQYQFARMCSSAVEVCTDRGTEYKVKYKLKNLLKKLKKHLSL